MPVRFLTDADRERLSQFPPEIPLEDLHTYFALSPADLVLVQTQRGDHQQLGFALQLGALRYLGFCPDDLTAASALLVQYVAQQLHVDPAALQAYGSRAHTRTDHLLKIQGYLGYRPPTEEDLQRLADWLVDRALEHDKPTLLLHLAAEKLQRDKLVRPGITRLERLVATVRERAQQETYHLLTPLLTPERQTLLDGLLVRDSTLGRTRLDWLRQEATANAPRAILAAIEKLTFLREHSVDTWDLGVLNPNRRTFLARLGTKATNQILARAIPERRYPILVAFLAQALQDRTDEALDLFSQYLAGAYRTAERHLEAFRQSTAKATNAHLWLFQRIAGIVLDPMVADAAVRGTIFQQVPEAELRAAVESSAALVRPPDDQYFDFLAQSYPTIRSFAPALLRAFTFQGNTAARPLLDAIALLRTVNAENRRKIPQHAPLGFVSDRWEPYVLEPNGLISKRYYELCVLWELRAALRAGNIWVAGSRRYANPDSYLIPDTRWPHLRAEFCAQAQVSVDGAERLRQRQATLINCLIALDQTLPGNAQVRIENGSVVLTPLKAEELPASVDQLRQVINERLPRIDLTDLVIEVDRWVHFTQHFEHAGGSEPRTPDLRAHLYAAVLAQGCNFGLTTMAHIADFSYWRLAWCTNWYIREETLRPAIVTLVNFQHRQRLSKYWGGGTLSSSDGQRFPVAVRNRHARALPRYFGYGKGLTMLSWTSDQHTQYGSKVVPSTVRDSTYVLDAMLDNETDLPIVEHATDTAGVTDIIFALFDLLNLQFSPRIRDLGDQRLYRMERTPQAPTLAPLLKGTINQKLIVEHWDALLRIAASLKFGWVPASLLIARMQAAPRQNAVTRALQEYGRLIRTIFILRYLESEQYRRRIEVQLNKGEALHALRQFLFFAHEGQLRKRQAEAQADQAHCLTVLADTVIAWNTVYMTAVLEQLQREGYPVNERDLEHLSPARYEHINPYGKYRFNLEEELNRTALRPLRSPEAVSD